jgi:hypothetical protein
MIVTDDKRHGDFSVPRIESQALAYRFYPYLRRDAVACRGGLKPTGS